MSMISVGWRNKKNNCDSMMTGRIYNILVIHHLLYLYYRHNCIEFFIGIELSNVLYKAIFKLAILARSIK